MTGWRERLVDATAELSVEVSRLPGAGQRLLLDEAQQLADRIARERGLGADERGALQAAAEAFGAPFPDEPPAALLTGAGSSPARVPPSTPWAARPAAAVDAADGLVAANLAASERFRASSLPAPGARIGQYEIIRELGRGGMGAVYAARDTKLGRKVAIKFLRSDHPGLTARFLLEARATARCSHENIVVIHEVGEHGGDPFMVLEYLQGAPLGTLLEDGRRLPPAQAVELIVPVVRALTAAHAHGIVHRDLKPDNIFITDSGAIKVLDFGIAKLVHDDDDGAALLRTVAANPSQLAPAGGRELTHRGHLMGTLPYMSPEQWSAGSAAVDHRTDLWAAGILLFEMVAGHHPLAPRRGWDLMITGVVSEPMPSVRLACPDLPDELASIIDHCLRKPKDERIGSAKELLDALEPLLPGRHVYYRLRSDESPFAGLRSFQEFDAHRFFGRDRDIAAAVARLRDAPLVGIVGPSGVGKSSFVRAGLVPALKASGESWSTVVVRPGRAPMAALASALGPMLDPDDGSAGGDWTEHELIERLRAEPGYLGTTLRDRARSRGQRVLVFVDQFEELYTQVTDPRERLAFTACLAGVCDDANAPLRLVLSLRSDFLDHVSEAPALMTELTRGLYFLAPPSREGLRDALRRPAEMAGYQFEAPSMIESMLDHLEHTPGALPLLQFAASQLWETRDRDRRLLTVESYHRIGGVAGALARHADAVVAECSPREQSDVRALLLRLVTAERTRATVPVSELWALSSPAAVQRVVERLVRSRLVVCQTTVKTGGTSSAGTLEIVHESLIHGWPLLRRWLDESQDDAAFLEQLRDASRHWQRKGYAPDLLWRGEAMQDARRWHSRHRGELPELQRAYLDAVFALAARATRRRRLGTAALGFLSALAVTAGAGLYVVEDQLHQIQAAERAAAAEHDKALTANRQLETRNTQLTAAIGAANRAREEAELARTEAETAQAAAEAARQRAELAKRREARSRRRATEVAAIAEVAADDARRASEQVAALLDQERKRVEELMGATRADKLVPDVVIRDPDTATTDLTFPNTGVALEARRAARTAFLEGNRLFHVPLFSRAAEKYTEALHHWSHPAFYFNLAVAQLNLGQDLEAHASLEHALKFGAEPLGDRFEEAGRLRSEIQGRLGRIRVSCAIPGAEVMLDGVTLFVGPSVMDLWVLPRAHEVTARTPDHATQSERVMVAAGAQQTVTLSLRKPTENRP